MSPGSIPAHAGEPPLYPRPPPNKWVYPRPRGGTGRTPRWPPPRSGLSPPTRGNPNARTRATRRRRSIPAHAGEPTAADATSWATTVYPRPRGGTDDRRTSTPRRPGLSPPTRGNPIPRASPPRRRGSIPAHAGEPAERVEQKDSGTVYPRPRGGTLTRRRRMSHGDGLSPPTRGNLQRKRARDGPRRSIPAHAGEPPRR